MTSDNNKTTAAGAATERCDTPLSLGAFRERAAAADSMIEAWVRCSVMGRDIVAGQDHLDLIDPDETAAEEVECVFADEVQFRLNARHGAPMHWDQLIGSTVYLRLRAVPLAPLAVTDVEPAWVEATLRKLARACLRELAEYQMRHLQAQLPEPEQIGRIGVIAAEDDPAWPSAKASLDALASDGLSYVAEFASFDGRRGTISLNGALKRMTERVAEGQIDLVLLIYGGEIRDGLHGLNDEDLAMLVCTMPVPVAIGLPQPHCASLLHQVAFAATDTPSDAVAIVTAIVRADRDAPERERRLSAWRQRFADRYAARH